jgi:serine/threonine-protein kinase
VKACTVCGAEWPEDTKFCPNDGTTLHAPAAGADLVGSIVADKFHIEKKLGEGGMGTVYLAEHVKMRRKSAIKVMAPTMASDPEAIARFNREAANAARINHPNVCQIYDFGETKDGTIFLAMEFIEGESLSDLLQRDGRLSLERAAGIVRQTGAALQVAHDEGIVHRDLKPDNIMLTSARDGSDVVKVVDFGIAKAMTGEEGQKVTKTGLVVGTPEYMSPEQLSGDVLDGRSDIYSLALVLFRSVTGSLPFQAESAQETMVKRLTDAPLKLAQVAPDAQWPPRLQGVMDRALERMPADRYASAAMFVSDVANAVRSAEVPLSVDTEGATQVMESSATDELTPTRVSSEPRTVTPQTPAAAPSPPRPPPKKKPVMAIAASIAAVAAIGGGTAVVMLQGNEEQGAGIEGTAGGPVDVRADTARPVAQGDIVRQPGGESGGETQQPAQAGGDPPPVITTPAATPPVDTAAVRQQILVIGRQIVRDSTRDGARLEAVGIYNDISHPAGLRALAASVIAESYAEENDNIRAEACSWIDRAIALDPDNDSFRQYRNLFLSCAP